MVITLLYKFYLWTWQWEPVRRRSRILWGVHVVSRWLRRDILRRLVLLSRTYHHHHCIHHHSHYTNTKTNKLNINTYHLEREDNWSHIFYFSLFPSSQTFSYVQRVAYPNFGPGKKTKVKNNPKNIVKYKCTGNYITIVTLRPQPVDFIRRMTWKGL